MKELNKLAKKCGVDRVHEDAGRPKVVALFEALKASSCSGRDKAEAQRIFSEYSSTFPGDGTENVAAEVPPDRDVTQAVTFASKFLGRGVAPHVVRALEAGLRQHFEL